MRIRNALYQAVERIPHPKASYPILWRALESPRLKRRRARTAALTGHLECQGTVAMTRPLDLKATSTITMITMTIDIIPLSAPGGGFGPRIGPGFGEGMRIKL